MHEEECKDCHCQEGQRAAEKDEVLVTPAGVPILRATGVVQTVHADGHMDAMIYAEPARIVVEAHVPEMGPATEAEQPIDGE